MAKADLHVHTSHSDGMYDVAELLDYVESETDLDLFRVTDSVEEAVSCVREVGMRRFGLTYGPRLSRRWRKGL